MFKNYFKITFRNLKKHKGLSFINITGLAIGVASCVLIGLWIEDELSYDGFHDKSERIYRIARRFDLPDVQVTIPNTPAPLAQTLKSTYPEVEEAVRISGPGCIHSRTADKRDWSTKGSGSFSF